MAFTVERKEGYALFKINAEKLDSNVAPAVKSELVLVNSDGVKNVIMDISDSRYCDSSGLSAILVGNRLCKNSGGGFYLCGLQDGVKKLISISQLDSILKIFPDTESAVAELKNSATKKTPEGDK